MRHERHKIVMTVGLYGVNFRSNTARNTKQDYTEVRFGQTD